MTALAQRQGPKDLLASMKGGGLYKAAAEKGVSLSRFLEMEDPSDRYKDGTDAFSRMMKEAGIVTHSDPQGSYYADLMEVFDKSDEVRALLPEWAARRWREVSFGGKRSAKATYTSDGAPLNSGLNPYFDQPGIVTDPEVSAAIPLTELIATTQPVRGDAVRATYLTASASQARLVRVVEAAEIPRARLTTSERIIRLYKYGRVLERSYEAMRRTPIDEMALYIQELAVQAEIDKVATVLDILVNGDGNAGTAATNYNLTTLDPNAVAGTMTTRGWLAFKLKFANPSRITTALTQEAIALQLQLLNLGSANVPLVSVEAGANFGGFAPINPQLRDQVALGWTSDAPANVVVGFDRRRAVRRYVEIGSDIEEAVKWATRQVEGVVLSETEGYSILRLNSARTLTVNG